VQWEKRVTTDPQQNPELESHHFARSGALWFSAGGGLVVWLIHLFVSYALATILCMPGQLLLLHGVTVVTGLISLVTSVVGWRIRARLQHVDVPAGGQDIYRRSYFMATFGIYNGLFFMAVIVAQGLPNFFLDPCVTAG
jgi:hypothetical protein